MESSLRGKKQGPEQVNNILPFFVRKGERRMHIYICINPGRIHTKLSKSRYDWLVDWEKEQGRWDVVGVYRFIFWL